MKERNCGSCAKWNTDNCPYLRRGQYRDDKMVWCWELKDNQ